MIKVLNVAAREFVATVLTKGFILGFLLPPVMIGAVLVLMPLLMNNAAPKVEGHIAVIDRSGAVAQRLQKAFDPDTYKSRREQRMAEAMSHVPKGAVSPDQAKLVQQAAGADAALKVVLLDPAADPDLEKKPILDVGARAKDAEGTNPRLALVVIPPKAVAVSTGEQFDPIELFVAPKLDIEVQGDIAGQVERAVVDARIENRGMDVQEVRELVRNPRVEAKAVTASGDRSINEVAKFLVPAAFMILLWISVFSCGQYLLTSTIEEKASRVMEVVLSAVSPLQLMAGKILGQMCVGLLILCVYAGAGGAGLVFAAMTELINPWHLVYLAIYFIIAFSLIACMMAAVGSAVSELREAQALIGPVMIILVIPMMLWMPLMRNPNSTFAQVLSFIPPVSPFVMVLRVVGSEKVPFWQIPASMAVGFASVAVFLWAAAKIFRIGVLMYGKPPNFLTLLKWVRMA